MTIPNLEWRAANLFTHSTNRNRNYPTSETFVLWCSPPIWAPAMDELKQQVKLDKCRNLEIVPNITYTIQTLTKKKQPCSSYVRSSDRNCIPNWCFTAPNWAPDCSVDEMKGSRDDYGWGWWFKASQVAVWSIGVCRSVTFKVPFVWRGPKFFCFLPVSEWHVDWLDSFL